jgi:hypothetical protein
MLTPFEMFPLVAGTKGLEELIRFDLRFWRKILVDETAVDEKRSF